MPTKNPELVIGSGRCARAGGPDRADRSFRWGRRGMIKAWRVVTAQLCCQPGFIVRPHDRNCDQIASPRPFHRLEIVVFFSIASRSDGWTVDSGGTLNVFGSSLGDSVYGTMNVFSGGMEGSGGPGGVVTTVNAGGLLTISSGGTGSDTQVVGTETVEAGGTEVGAFTQPSGQIVDYGLVSGGLLHAGSTEYVESGGTDSGLVILGNGIQNVESGGTAINTSFGGGIQNVFGGGVVLSTSVPSGTQNILSGAVVSGEVIGGAGNTATQNVSSGGTVINMLVEGGGIQNVYSGGTASGTTVSNTGILNLFGDAAATYTISVGGTLGIGSGYVLSGYNASAHLTVLAGGTAVSALADGQDMAVDSGGVAIGTTISGAFVFVSAGGTASGTIIDSGGEYLFGLGFNETINTGTFESIGSGGVASGDMIVGAGQVFSGGHQVVLSGGTDLNATISGAGRIEVQSGGEADFTIVQNVQAFPFVGLYVDFGGTARSTTINGGDEGVAGVDIGAVVNSGGFQVVQNGGLTSGTIVSSGGTEIVTPGATASGTIVNSGGNETVSSGGSTFIAGTDQNARISGGEQDVYGVATGDTIFTGSQVVESGGTASNTVVSGGALDVLSGGLADPVTIFSGGSETVSVGGTDLGAQISGGTQTVFAQANGDSIFAGFQIVSAGGTASGLINSGGEQDVYGLSINTHIYGSRAFGAFGEHVFAGGTASGTVVSGTFNYGLFVDTGGTAIGTLISGNGAAEAGAGFQGGTFISTTLRGDSTGSAFLAMFSSNGLAISTTISSGGEMNRSI
jgi:autotransporter passenger strand-loop-strand repeat protein